jgi:hypothetical protein
VIYLISILRGISGNVKIHIFKKTENTNTERRDNNMDKNKETSNAFKNEYDDGNIPDVDLPQDCGSVEPLPESSRPRKDGPGGD